MVVVVFMVSMHYQNVINYALLKYFSMLNTRYRNVCCPFAVASNVISWGVDAKICVMNMFVTT